MKRNRRMLNATGSPFGETTQRLLQVHPVSDHPGEILSIADHLLSHFAAVQRKEIA